MRFGRPLVFGGSDGSLAYVLCCVRVDSNLLECSDVTACQNDALSSSDYVSGTVCVITVVKVLAYQVSHLTTIYTHHALISLT